MSNEETPIIFMSDPKTGEPVYIQTHVDAVDGLPDDFEDYDLDGLQDNVSSLNDNIGTVQSQLNAVQSQINNLVTDTGWINLPLSNGITEYTSTWTPRARLMSVNGVYFLSLQGAVKGLTGPAIIGNLPSSMANRINNVRQFVQAMSVTSSTPNFNRWRINTDGTIALEFSTTSITNTQWVSIDATIML